MSQIQTGKQQAAANKMKHDLRRFYTVVLLYVFCTIFYYFGEIIDFLGWSALRWEFFYGVHDTHRLLFLAPIVYAGYFFGTRAAIIFTIVAINTFLPRALFISPFPDPLLRTVLFVIIAGIIGYLTGRESDRRRYLERLVRRERDQILGILKGMDEGVLIIGPDYTIRSINESMSISFGDGLGMHCYEFLCKSDRPCPNICRLPEVISGKTEKWEYRFPDGSVCQVLASPYVDTEGTTCQLAVFKNVRK